MKQFGSYTESIAVLGILYMSDSNPMRKEAYQTAMNALAEEQRKAMQEFEADHDRAVAEADAEFDRIKAGEARHDAEAIIELTSDMEVK